MKKSQHPQIIPTQAGILQIDQKDIGKFLGRVKSHNDIKIVYFGTPEFSAYILEQLIKFSLTSFGHTSPDYGSYYGKKFIIQAVVTRADKPVGQKQEVRQSPVSTVAQKYYIPTLKPAKLDEDFIKNHLSLLDCDLFVVASYGKILPQDLLNIPKLGALNVHGSILPKYRGASPIQVAILNGDKQTGVTIMLMDAEMDHGPILSTKGISILNQDNFETLSNKMMLVAALLLIDTMGKFVDGKITPRVQRHAIASFCPLIKKEDGYFDIENPPSPETLERMIRAYYPWPGVWTRLRLKSFGGQARIVKFLPTASHPELDSGSIPFLVQMEGKKPLPLKDFLNGYPDFPMSKVLTSQ